MTGSIRPKLLLGLLLFVSALGLGEDFRPHSRRAVHSAPIVYDRVTRQALSFGRATGEIPATRVHEIVKAVNQHQAIPADLANTWQKLVRAAQLQLWLEHNDKFFPVGYELETVHPGHLANEEFAEGGKRFREILSGSFPVQSAVRKKDADTITYFDSKKREWVLSRESVHENAYKGGYELGTPPFFAPEDLQEYNSFRWRLGNSRFGQSNKMTGGHQTFTLVPIGETADSRLIARTAANFQLLQAQYAPALYEILDTKRWGGPLNFYFRPWLFDHGELLARIKNTPSDQMDLPFLKKLQFDDYIEKEFEVQARAQLKIGNITEAELVEGLAWSKEEKAKYRPAWKYRDTQIKFNLKEPKQTLIEVRIGDYVASRPEQALLETYVYEKMLERAHEMAKKGEVFQLNIPQRGANQSELEYWELLRLRPESSPEALLQTLQIDDPNRASLILGRSFKVAAPAFKAGVERTYAFEVEGHTDRLVEFIIPRDPALRKEWDGIPKKAKVEILKDKGVVFDGSYSQKRYIALTTEFTTDIDHYPYLSRDLHVEASGNWEIKSNARGFKSVEDLKKAVKTVANKLPGEGFGLHLHAFIPQSQVAAIKGPLADRFVSFLERESLYMAVAAYAEADREYPAHYFDSWSLDRYSPEDLEKVRKHLNGEIQLSSIDQKYHNIGFRPVIGGIDVEVRDVGDAVDFGFAQLQRVENGFANRDFGEIAFRKDNAIFMEFKEHAEPEKVARYTLENAVAEKYALSAQERELLRKMQFEIYKPSMSEYVCFSNFSCIGETPDALLDARLVRTNFENNVAIPLLNLAEQGILSEAEITRLAAGRVRFVDQIHQLLQEVGRDSAYAFLHEDPDFLYLADFLKRSTHESRPNFKKLPPHEAVRRREALEELTYKIRSKVVQYVQDTNLAQLLDKSVVAKSIAVGVGSSCVRKFRPYLAP